MPAIDPFEGFPPSKNFPFDNLLDGDLRSDTQDLPFIASAIYIPPLNAAGVGQLVTVKVTTAGGSVYTINIYEGDYIKDFRVRRVWATGTTAARLVAYW